jgi:hypothetical protein
MLQESFLQPKLEGNSYPENYYNIAFVKKVDSRYSIEDVILLLLFLNSVL